LFFNRSFWGGFFVPIYRGNLGVLFKIFEFDIFVTQNLLTFSSSVRYIVRRHGSQSNKQNMNILIGTDPEFALKDSTNRIVSAIPVLERGKNDKIDLGEGAKIYYDNVLAEANIDPSASKEELKDRLKSLYQKSKVLLQNLKLSATASHEFGFLECLHEEAKRFGCDPELDLDMGGPAYPPEAEGGFRSAGGHIHIGGLEGQDIYEKARLIPILDILVGIPSVILDNDPTSLARKRLYGKAGRFRDTPYGIEYRTLSNYWLSCPELTEIIYDLTMESVNFYLTNKDDEVNGIVDRETVVNTINNADKETARQIVENLPVSQEIKERIFQLSANQYNDDIFQNWGI